MTPTAYPLCWPDGQVRTHPHARKSAYVFNRRESCGSRRVTVHEALCELREELARMGISDDDIVISTDVPTRLDGLPRSGVSPDDPGAAVWFRRGGELRCIAVDLFDYVAGNLRAIALVIDGLRRLERYGCAGMIQSAARALFDAPALPPVAGPGRRCWHEVLGVAADAPSEVIEAAYKALAKSAHPDVGGNRQDWDELARAIEEARSRKE